MKQQRKETLVYGGAFHPPTLAHQAIVQACVDYARRHDADVWLLPSASRKDKDIAASRVFRLEMLEALIHDVETKGVNVTVSLVELDRGVATETYATVQELSDTYPDRRFVWVFGTDSLASMPLWHGGEWLLCHLPMLIVEREGSPSILPGEHAQYLGIQTGGMSSTEVRRRLASGETYDELVSPRIGALLATEWHS